MDTTPYKRHSVGYVSSGRQVRAATEFVGYHLTSPRTSDSEVLTS